MGNEGTDGEEDTETKLAILSSIFTSASPESLFDVLIRADGKVERAIDIHLDSAKRPATDSPPPHKRQKRSVSPVKRPSFGSPEKSLSSVLKWTPTAEPPRKVPFRLRKC